MDRNLRGPEGPLFHGGAHIRDFFIGLYVRPDLRRYEHGKHVLFYRRENNGIVVSRILHQRMLPERHAIEDE